MYLDFYGLKEKPFNLTPDSNFIFLSTQHQEALGHIRYGIEDKKGFILITGEIGAGKTTICRTLLKELDKNYRVALILNSLVSPTGLLKAIIRDLGIETKARSRQDMTDVLNKYLLEEENVIIVIDEAQNLNRPALEQIRLLGNLETEKDKLLQIVLVGQPELRRILAHQRFTQLNQRIAVRYHLQPMNREETHEYIQHRLNVAGNNGKIIFEDNALQKIYNYSGGVPRLINILCDYCLITGFVYETFTIDASIAEQSIKEYDGQEPQISASLTTSSNFVTANINV